jgi:hypothetical protein
MKFVYCAVHSEFVMFYSTDPCGLYHKNYYGRNLQYP